MHSFQHEAPERLSSFRFPRFDSMGGIVDLCHGDLGEFSFCFLFLQVPASGNEYNELGLRDTGVLCYFS